MLGTFGASLTSHCCTWNTVFLARGRQCYIVGCPCYHVSVCLTVWAACLSTSYFFLINLSSPSSAANCALGGGTLLNLGEICVQLLQCLHFCSLQNLQKHLPLLDNLGCAPSCVSDPPFVNFSFIILLFITHSRLILSRVLFETFSIVASADSSNSLNVHGTCTFMLDVSHFV